MKKATLKLSKDSVISDIDDRIYGSFIEHLGRAVYQGIYQPQNPLSDENGFRKDVLSLVQELNVPTVRYPGGNFVSGYDWKNGIGDKNSRPQQLDLAWFSIESNQFGLNEFVDWCKEAGTSPMMAVNLGTKGITEAKELVEYCNFEQGTYWSDLRRQHGYEKPHDIKLWCLGNEMDGGWQIGHKTAYEYARLANETAKVMKWVDPSIELVACGSSGCSMPTFGEWETTVLTECYDNIDYISLHQYYQLSQNGSTAEFLAESTGMGEMIDTISTICDLVKMKRKGKKDIYLSFDEWNVWNHGNDSGGSKRWAEAPALLEEAYTLEDALLVGCILIQLINHSDRVKIACLAQLVNVIAPIMTSDTGCWRQTIFYPYFHASRFGRGRALSPTLMSPQYTTDKFGAVNCVDCAVVENEEQDSLTIFAVNRDVDEDILLSCSAPEWEGYQQQSHIVLNHMDVKAANTETCPNRVVPTAVPAGTCKDGRLEMILQRHSWNVVVLKKDRKI